MKKHKEGIIVTTLIIIGVLLVNDLFFFGGNIRFYSKWVECGHKPLEGRGGYGTGIQWYEESSTIAFVRNQTWFCTPLEAEQAGYSASEHQWSTPHLDAHRK